MINKARNLRLKSRFLICFFIFSLSVFCFSSDYNPNGKLILGLGGEVSVLNPILSTDTSSSAVEGTIFSGLIRFNEKMEPVPDLAYSWNVSPDAKVWTFYLRRDIFWHDGEHFNAQDVKFTFESILNPKVNSVRRSDYIIDGEPIQIKVVNNYCVQFILPKPFAPFITRVGMGIIPINLLEDENINTSAFNRRPIGTGPFTFKEWKSGDHITVVRNDNYYLKEPKLKEITFKVIPDENTQLLALEAGEIDETGIPAKDYERIKKTAHINVYEYDSLLYTYLGLNMAKKPFLDKRVRQALAYATDKDQLVNLIFKGLATPAYAPSAPVSWAYSNNVAIYPYDLEKAKQLLAEAGFERGFSFTCLVNKGNKDRERAAVILQQQYKKIGVNMKIRTLEWSALLKIINASFDPKDFDAVIIGWSLGLDPDAYSIWHSSEYPRGFNFIKYNNPDVDKLLEQGRITVARAKRKKIYAKIWELISDDQPYVFLWYPKVISGVRDRVGGLSVPPGPMGLFVDIEKIYIKK